MYHHLKHSGSLSNCEEIGLKIESPKAVELFLLLFFFVVCLLSTCTILFSSAGQNL